MFAIILFNLFSSGTGITQQFYQPFGSLVLVILWCCILSKMLCSRCGIFIKGAASTPREINFYLPPHVGNSASFTKKHLSFICVFRPF
jgi:hypothetical protein